MKAILCPDCHGCGMLGCRCDGSGIILEPEDFDEDEDEPGDDERDYDLEEDDDYWP